MDQENSFNKLFDKKVAATVFLVSSIFAGFQYFTNPIRELQKGQIEQGIRLETLRNNDFAHLSNDVKDLKSGGQLTETQIQDIQQQLTRIEVLLEQMDKTK